MEHMLDVIFVFDHKGELEVCALDEFLTIIEVPGIRIIKTRMSELLWNSLHDDASIRITYNPNEPDMLAIEQEVQSNRIAYKEILKYDMNKYKIITS